MAQYKKYFYNLEYGALYVSESPADDRFGRIWQEITKEQFEAIQYFIKGLLDL